MKLNITERIGKLLLVLAALTVTTGAFGESAKDTMCVKQKDGTYKCKASGGAKRRRGSERSPLPRR